MVLRKAKEDNGSFITFFILKLCSLYSLTANFLIKEDEQREMSNILNVVHQNIEQALKTHCDHNTGTNYQR
jgi:hypothetical protein